MGKYMEVELERACINVFLAINVLFDTIGQYTCIMCLICTKQVDVDLQIPIEDVLFS